MALEVISRSRKGNFREVNEDSLIVTRVGEVDVLAVADGLGGYSAGEVASNLAVNRLVDSLKTDLFQPGLRESVEKAVQQVNQAIALASRVNPAREGMASTLVTALITPAEILIANIGDSRAYLVGGAIRRITCDHSLVQQMLDRGIITEAESTEHDHKNIITRCLGRHPDVSADFFNAELGRDVLLLCSDGLSNTLRDNEIRSVISAGGSLSAAADRLLEKLEERQADDDASLILAQWVSDSFSSR